MDALFTVQAEDTHARQLSHRRDTLPERAQIAEAEARKAQLLVARAEVAAERDELARQEKRIEDEVSLLADKVKAEEHRLYHGSITSPKEAQALQDEIASLGRRLDGLENAALELLVETEPLEERLVELDEQMAAIDEATRGAVEAVAAAETEIDQQLAQSRRIRQEAAQQVPSDLLAKYEKYAPRFRESTIVRFGGGTCPGCPSAMPAMEVDRVKGLPTGEITDCQECGRLVAT